MYEKELQQLGLSEKESRTYLAALELGPNTVQNIAKKAEINRPTAYVQIESLKKKGLMSEIKKGSPSKGQGLTPGGGRTYYIAESPERLDLFLRELKKKIELKKEELSKILPDLNKVFYSGGERPVVRFFEGIEGARTMREEFLNTKSKKAEGFINLDKLLEIFPEQDKEYSTRRAEKKIESLAIYTRKNGPLGGADNPQRLRKVKYIDSRKLSLDADISIYDDNVAITTYKTKPIGIIIQSKEIANTMRSIFYMVWGGIIKP